jgi:nucleoid-associated protein YgaU
MGILDKVLGRDDAPDRAPADFSDVRGNARTTPGAPPVTSAADAAPRPDFSDVQAASRSAPVERERTYTVVAGDSLSRIARREYGDESQWRRIYEANRGTISDPDLIHPGQVLSLPADL